MMIRVLATVPTLALLSTASFPGVATPDEDVRAKVVDRPSEAIAPVDTTYVDEGLGFTWELPEGWSTSDQDARTTHARLNATREGQDPRIQFSLRVLPTLELAGYGPAEAARVAILGKPEYSEYETLEVEALGHTLEGMRVQLQQGGHVHGIEQAYFVREPSVFILQWVAPPDQLEEAREAFGPIVEGIEIGEPGEATAGLSQLQALAARCGSELDWAPTWSAAAERARRAARPILVVAWRYPGFSLQDAMSSGPFMDPDIVELIGERAIPYRLSFTDGCPLVDPGVYGLGPSTFGNGALFVDADGRVLYDGGLPRYGSLAAALATIDPPSPISDSERGSGLDAVDRRMARGELEAALDLLGDRSDADAHLRRAEIHRRRRRGQESLEAYAQALEADPKIAGASFDLERAKTLAALGRIDPAQLLLRSILEGAEHPSTLSEARYVLGAIQRVHGTREESQSTWQPLFEGDPEDRWAWKAAATLTSPAWGADVGGRVDWPSEAWYAVLERPKSAPLGARGAVDARDHARDFLVGAQDDRGGWISPTEAAHRNPLRVDDFKLAITALAGRGLLRERVEHRHASWDGVDPVERPLEEAIEHVLGTLDRMATHPAPIHYMDYGVWSHAMALEFLCEVEGAGLRTREQLEAPVAQLVAGLAQKEKPRGGWSYYLTRDLAARAPVQGESISFTTAAVVLALEAARDHGFPLPEGLLDRGLNAIEAMHRGDAVYVYMQDLAGTTRPPAPHPAGAAGRAPLIALALYRGGRCKQDHLVEALDLFALHRAGLDAEMGKWLMHTGPHAQGSHYLMFDYAHAALCAAELPRNEGRRYHDAILDSVLNGRCEGGCFVDNGSRGPAMGTGLALVAFDALGIGGQ